MSDKKLVRKYGWKPSVLDHRDIKFVQTSKATKLPETVDLRPEFPACYDQLNLGSCVANAVAGLFEWLQKKEKRWEFTGSRLFLYWNERKLDHNPAFIDTGSTVRSGLKGLAKFGVPDEKLYPYVIANFDKRPEDLVKGITETATHHKLHYYFKIDNTNLSDLQACLAEGFPFVFGFSAFADLESDEVAKTGMLSLPGADDKSIGGHCVVAVGYITIKGTLYFICRNSWGNAWSVAGYFFMPADYLTNPNLANDFWTCRAI
jgi:C1A family cysteine protease